MPNCKDSHSTYFEGITSIENQFTKAELVNIEKTYKKEQRNQYKKRQYEKYGTLAKYSLDPGNKEKYIGKMQQWEGALDTVVPDVMAGVLPERFKGHLPDKERRAEIIKEGIALERPIFDDGTLGTFAERLVPEPGYYDVVLHGEAYGLEFFGEPLDVETLCAIIIQRDDYQRGMKIRLVSCNTGREPDGVAQYIADRLGVEVLAPENNAAVKLENGKSTTYSCDEFGQEKGKYKPFTPSKGKSYGISNDKQD